jgi:hypothetical protein
MARTVAHGYERLHLQHPSLNYAEVVRNLLTERKSLISRYSPEAAKAPYHRTSLLMRSEDNSLADFAVHIALAELRQEYDDLDPDDLRDIRQLLRAGIDSTLGYVPDASLSSVQKALDRDHFLASLDGYRSYLKATFGAVQLLRPPTAPWENGVLQTRAEWERALQQVHDLRLPAHFQPAKNWDGLGAIDCILRRTGPDAWILDAGTELYSVFLPSLSLYGYLNLTGINLVFEDDIRMGPIRYGHGDIVSTKFADGTFDAVACLSVIEHGVDLDAYFKEMARLLKPGGVLVTSTDYFETPIDTKGMMDFGVPVHIFCREEIRDATKIAKIYDLYLTSPLDLSCSEKPVRWEELDLEYTFLIFTLEKRIH